MTSVLCIIPFYIRGTCHLVNNTCEQYGIERNNRCYYHKSHKFHPYIYSKKNYRRYLLSHFLATYGGLIKQFSLLSCISASPMWLI